MLVKLQRYSALLPLLFRRHLQLLPLLGLLLARLLLLHLPMLAQFQMPLVPQLLVAPNEVHAKLVMLRAHLDDAVATL